jgi:hypothetical protein
MQLFYCHQYNITEKLLRNDKWLRVLKTDILTKKNFSIQKKSSSRINIYFQKKSPRYLDKYFQ